jgi:predicted permease
LSTSLAGQRLLKASVVVQVALALVLLLGSGLMIRTLSRLLAADPGFQPPGIVTAMIAIPAATYDSGEKTLGFFDALLDGVRAIPGVESAALVTGLPFAQANDSSPFDIPGRPSQPGGLSRHAEASAVSPGYFDAMGIPIVMGRDFDGSERPGTPTVAIIDQTFADQFFPGENPVGQTITGYFGSETTIIGVARAVDHDEIGDAPKALAYYATSHQYWMRTRALAIRTSLPVGSVTASLRDVVARLDPNVPVDDVQTMEGRIERSLGPRRLAMLALGAFSGLSLVLAALGVYGVMRYTTGQRTREIGVRIALGAQPGAVVGQIVRQGLAVALVGVAIGTAVAWSATQLMEGMLFGVTPRDPATFVIGAVVLVIVTVLASLLPALSAARVDPVSALRND